jgi:mxaK protein
METRSLRLKTLLLRHWPHLALLFAAAWLGLTVFFGLEWWYASALNLSIKDGSLIKHAVKPGEFREAYAMGYFAVKQDNIKEAVRYFTLVEASDDPALRARAKFALGNLYFGIGLKAADIESGQGHIHGLAQIELSREAYKGALRINPQLWDARYNLELIDRLSPPKRVEGWERSVDGVTLMPQKRDGWASMKDNTRRGLP